MHLQSLTIKNFRCFERLDLVFDKPIIVIEGNNGSGKTSLLEALYYACYLRSFRTHVPADLVRLGTESFFVKAVLTGLDAPEVHVGFADKKRLVKLNQKTVTTYKELFDVYRVVTATEDDLQLIKGGPEHRRTFIDHICLMYDSEYAQALRSFRQIVYSRNALLKRHPISDELYELWTEKLVTASAHIQAVRQQVMQLLQEQVAAIIEQFFQGRYAILLQYQSSIETDIARYKSDEIRFGRSLYGAHLDDITIFFQGQRARLFASRGQQKLMVLLLKMAHIRLLNPTVVMLDDFMTDFDKAHIQDFIRALTDMKSQLFFTVPQSSGSLLYEALKLHPVQRLQLD